MKYWEDRNCHPLIYVGDFPYNVLKTTSHNPEAADVQHEADRMFTSTGRTATRTGGCLDMENTSDTDSVAELEYNTWDDARAWKFRNARGNMDVSLFQNLQIEMNRADESEVDTVIGYDADYSARKRVSRRQEYVQQRSFRCRMFRRRWSGIQRRTGSKATLIMMKVRRNVSMRNGLREYFILRGLGITTSMGGGTVVCRYMTEWLSQIVSMPKMAIVCHTRYVMIV